RFSQTSCSCSATQFPRLIIAVRALSRRNSTRRFVPESGAISPIVSSRRRRVMPRSALRQSNLFADAPHEGDIWSERLLAAFADATLHSGFLPLAEQAIEACPGDAIILMLAAMAALLHARPKRALVLLKRFSKPASAPAGDLLQALALNQLG